MEQQQEERQLNLFVEFQKNSGDFLKLLGELSMKADLKKPVTIQTKDMGDIAATLELFWDITEKIFLKYEERLVLLRMLSATEHAKSVIFQNELRNTYNELFKVRDKIPDTIARLMAKTAIPKKEEFDNEIVLKSKPPQATNG